MNPRITVIIPVYEVEKYLPRCINSIVKQSYSNLEIILVDDGSPDDCGRICDEYADCDARIKVIHKQNGGLSDARNVALDEMTGDFVTFVDSDDWISQFYVENLYSAIEQTSADMSISGMESVWNSDKVLGNNEKRGCIELKELTSQRCLEKMLYQDQIETSAWGKLYNKKLFGKLRYPKGRLYEDLAVTYKTIVASSSIAVISNRDYYYFQRENSIQYKKFSLEKMDAVIHVGELVEFVENEYPSITKAAYCRAVSAACNILFQIHSEEFLEQKKVLWDIIKKYRRIILFDRKARRKTRLAAMISYFGYKSLSLIYSKTSKRVGKQEKQST